MAPPPSPKKRPSSSGFSTSTTMTDDSSDTITTVSSTSSSPALSNVGTESSLRLKRAADTFVINARAKESIASTQLAQFFEILCVRLRQRLAELELQSKENTSVTVVEKDIVTSGLTSVLSPSSIVGGQTGLAALAMMMLSQGWVFQQIGFKAAVAFIVMTNVKRRTEQMVMDRRRYFNRCVVEQFQLGGGSSTTNKAGNAEDGLQIERGVREVARALSMRHVEQIVPLTRSSQMVLADVMVSRVIQHLQRGRFGYPEESRSPLVSSFQRTLWSMESAVHSVVTPPDRVPEKKTLSLLERCIRALTAEASPGDDVPLELEPWFSSSSVPSKVHWTANGVLSKTGLRVRIESEGDESELCFAHEFSDVQRYGYCYGAMFEARERHMRPVGKDGNPEPKISTRSKL